MAKNVDGIYDSDPKTNPYAKKYEELRYSDIINRNLKVIDFTAATMCMENEIPTLAFGLNEENSIVRAICGESLGCWEVLNVSSEFWLSIMPELSRCG